MESFKAIRIGGNKPNISIKESKRYLDYLSTFKDGEELIIEISSKRTSDQNRLFHKWVHIISEYIGESLPATKAWIVCTFFGCTEEVVEGIVYKIPISTSRINKKEFAQGVTNLLAWADEHNITLPK